MKAIQSNSKIIESLDCTQNMLLVIDLSFIFFNATIKVCSILIQSKSTGELLSKINFYHFIVCDWDLLHMLSPYF